MSEMLLNSLIKWGTHFNGFKRGSQRRYTAESVILRWICKTGFPTGGKSFPSIRKKCFTHLQTRIICIMVLLIKNSPANAGDLRDVGLIPGSGRSPGGGHGNPLQYSCLENPMDRGAWRATVHGVTKNWT